MNRQDQINSVRFLLSKLDAVSQTISKIRNEYSDELLYAFDQPQTNKLSDLAVDATLLNRYLELVGDVMLAHRPSALKGKR